MIQCSYIKVTGGALIEINSISYATVPGGTTLDITVENSAGTPVGVIAGDYIIADNTVSINGTVVLYAPAETAFDIDVFDSAGNPIGAINMSDEFIISDTVDTLNGVAITGAKAEGGKAIIVQTDDAIPVQVGTVLVDTDTSLTIEVPAGGGSYPISYVRDNGRYQITEFLTYDIKWYKDNTTVFDYIVEGIKPILDSSDETKLINNNSFGNLERATNDLGGTVFDGSDGSTVDYLVDHYTGLGWYLNDIYIGSNDWIGNNLMMQTFTYGGFSDWRLPTREDINQISTTDGLTTLLTPYKTFSKFLHYLLDSGSAVSITFWWEGKSYLDPARFTATNPNTNFTNVSSLAVRNHF